MTTFAKNNADLIAGAVGLGLLASGIGLLTVWPAALVVLGIAFIALAVWMP